MVAESRGVVGYVVNRREDRPCLGLVVLVDNRDRSVEGAFTPEDADAESFGFAGFDQPSQLGVVGALGELDVVFWHGCIGLVAIRNSG